MKKKLMYCIILALMFIALVMSIVLSFVPIEKACGNSLGEGPGGCTIVQTSDYESIMGVKNAYIGLVAFPILCLLTILELKKSKKYQKKLLQLGLIIGSVLALYFLYIQFFILKAICKYCLVLDIGTLISLGLIFFWKEKKIIK